MSRSVCSKCGHESARVTCKTCISHLLGQLRDQRDELLVRISELEVQVSAGTAGIYFGSDSASLERVMALERSIEQHRQKIVELSRSVPFTRNRLKSRLVDIASYRDAQRERKRKTDSRGDSSLSFETYIGDCARWDRNLSALHPYRKLRSVSQSLADERKSLCMKLLTMFRFRQLKVDGGTQIVAEDDNVDCVVGMSVLLLILLSRVLDVSYPFPLVFATLSSSPCLHVPSGVQAVPYPRILHAYKRVILPVTGDATLSSHALLLEDLRYLTDGTVFPSMDPLELIDQIISSRNLGHEVRVLKKSFPSSPSLSASYSPSYRRSIIEQSVTEGGEWTLLDQL